MNSILAFVRARKVVVGIVGAFLLLFLVRFVLLQQPSGEIDYTVQKEDLVDTVQVSGTYTTASQIPVNSPTNGIIKQLRVANGDMVKKGDSLFYVESSATDDQKKTAYAAYLAANATVQADTSTLYSLQAAMFKANQAFVNDRGIDNPTDQQKTDPTYVQEQASWLSAEAAYKNQENVLAKDQAALAEKKQAYDETQSVTVTAPAAGTIVNLLAITGDQVTASATTPVLVIANLSNPYMVANISQDYIPRITPGQKALLVFDGMKSRTFIGMVKTIALVGTNVQGVVTYGARITTPADLPPTIKPNMTATITIETIRKNNVIAVPNSAIITQNGKTYVETTAFHQKIPVVTGVKTTTKTEIFKGLSTGISIVANPNNN